MRCVLWTGSNGDTRPNQPSGWFRLILVAVQVVGGISQSENVSGRAKCDYVNLASRARHSETFLAKQRLGRSLEPELEREGLGNAWANSGHFWRARTKVRTT